MKANTFQKFTLRLSAVLLCLGSGLMPLSNSPFAGEIPAPASAIAQTVTAMVHPTLQACADRMHRPMWIISSAMLQREVSTLTTDWQRQVLDRPCVFLLGKADSPAHRSMKAFAVASAASVSGIEKSAANPAVEVLFYDPEVWSYTPLPEQIDPVAATCRAAELAHRKGKPLIVAPSLQLITVMKPGVSLSNQYQAFIDSQLAAQMAACVDGFDIQLQTFANNPVHFRRLTLALSQQIKAVNPHVLIFASLSANLKGRNLSGAQLHAAAASVAESVDGFYLANPLQPGEQHSKPEVLIDLLKHFD